MTDLEVYRPAADLAVPDLRDTDSWIAVCSDVIKVANVIFDTPFVPDGLRGSAPAVAAAILAGRELGIGPMTALQHIHVIKGKPAQSAALMRALIQGQGHKWQDGDVSDTRAVVRGCRKGESEWTEVSFTADQAKRAGIDLGKYPADKLYARATSRLARRKFADVIAGMPYSAEELEDGPGDVVLAGDPGYKADRQAAKDATPQPAQRTTRRRQAATPDASPADAATPPAAPASTAVTPPRRAAAPERAAGEAQLPPLPGEEEDGPAAGEAGKAGAAAGPDEPDERDYDSPGTVTRQQVGKLQTVYHANLGYTKAERELTMDATEDIIKRGLIGPHKASDGSDRTHNNLSFNEAKTLIDTLERCGTRERLALLLRTGEMPEAGTHD